MPPKSSKRAPAKATTTAEAERAAARGQIRCVGDGTSVIASMQAALNNDDFSDVIFIVGAAVPNVTVQRFHGHRCILAARSTVLRSLLLGGFAESQQKEIAIDDFHPDHFHAMLQWAYTGQAHMSPRDVLGVLRVAHFYQFDDLEKHCRQLAVEFVDEDCVLQLLESAISHDESEVIRSCLDFWARQPTVVLAHSKWSKQSPETLCTLLGHNSAACSEDTIFNGVTHWIEDAMGDDCDVSVAAEDRLELVQRILSLVRTGQLSHDDLMDGFKPLSERFGVHHDAYVAALEFKLAPDRFAKTGAGLPKNLRPRAPATAQQIVSNFAGVSEILSPRWRRVQFSASNMLSGLGLATCIPAMATYVAVGFVDHVASPMTQRCCVLAVGSARCVKGFTADTPGNHVTDDGPLRWTLNHSQLVVEPSADAQDAMPPVHNAETVVLPVTGYVVPAAFAVPQPVRKLVLNLSGVQCQYANAEKLTYYVAWI